MSLTILIPAAGASSRMGGRDKLLEDVGGAPLLRHSAARACATGATVIVVLSRYHPARRGALDGLGVILPGPIDATEGMGASLRAGMAALPDGATGVMILLADLPDLTTADLGRMIRLHDAQPDQILRATASDGTPGHPVVFPARCFPDLEQVTGDEGARSVLKGQPVMPVPLPGHHATTDLDTPEAWAAWRAAQGD